MADGSEPGVSGYAMALDQDTGEIEWEFPVVDGADVWGNPYVNGGGGLRYPPAVFLEQDLLYWGTGSPAPVGGVRGFPNGASRPGANLYTSSLIALGAQDGSLAWHKQLIPHDILGLDVQMSPVLASYEINGAQRTAVFLTGQIGAVFAVDIDTQELLWRTEVGEHQNDDLRTLPDDESVEVLPGLLGGVASPMAYQDGVLYAPVANVATRYSATSFGAADSAEALANTLAQTESPEEGTGNLVAIDVSDGEILWDRAFDSPSFGAATVAGNVVFTSTYDGMIFALHADDGEILWSFQAPARINGWPAIIENTMIIPAGVGDNPALLAFSVPWDFG